MKTFEPQENSQSFKKRIAKQREYDRKKDKEARQND